MKVLLLSQFYAPEVRTAPMNLAAMAETLQKRGHEVLVVTGFPNHPFGKVYDGYRMKWREWDEVGGVRVLRVPLFPDHSLSVLRRGLHYGSFALSAATIGAWMTRSFEADVLFVYLPPITNWLPIRTLMFWHRVPAVYWVTDVWPEAFAALGSSVRPSIVRMIKLLNEAVNRRASLICVNSPGLERKLVREGVQRDRLAVLTDWADESIFFPSEPDPELAKVHGLDGKFNIMYGGNLGPAQALHTIVAAAARLKDVPRVQFVLIGDGESRRDIRRAVETEGLDNVRFIARQPMNEIHRFYAAADVLLVHLAQTPQFEIQIPSKIMAYLACAKPILCAVSGVAADLVREGGAGVCCPPEDPEGLAEAVRALLARPPEERREMGSKGRELYLRRYTRQVQAERLETLLARVAPTVGAPL